jgi:hypothetical protein
LYFIYFQCLKFSKEIFREMKKLVMMFVICHFFFTTSGHKVYWNYSSPYNLALKKELINGGISLATFFTGSLLEHHEGLPAFNVGSFTPSDIQKINFIDRGVAGTWNSDASKASDILKIASKSGVQAALIFFPGNLKTRGSLFMIYLEGFYLTNGLTSLSKGMTDRYRPFTYMTQDQIDQMGIQEKNRFLSDISGSGIEDSFFSGHASSTAYGLVFLAKVFNDYFPDTNWKYGVWAFSLAGITLEDYFRVKSGNHFPTDVIVGSLVGGSIGFFMPWFHKKMQGGKLSFGINNTGLTFSYTF